MAETQEQKNGGNGKAPMLSDLEKEKLAAEQAEAAAEKIAKLSDVEKAELLKALTTEHIEVQMYKVPEALFSQVVQILGQLPYGQIGGIMNQLMRIRPMSEKVEVPKQQEANQS